MNRTTPKRGDLRGIRAKRGLRSAGPWVDAVVGLESRWTVGIFRVVRTRVDGGASESFSLLSSALDSIISSVVLGLDG